jgi:transcriptional regulator of arginine metabolism
MARNARQNKLLELISENNIETQDDLVLALKDAGFSVTQATVSRDIKELGLIKASIDGKKQRYVKENPDGNATSKFTDMFRHSVISIEHAMNIVVIRTLTGSANIAGMMIDRFKNASVLGCVAGDDTVFAVLRDERSAEELTEQLRSIAFD